MRSDRLRSLGEMAAGIAHELNQPLVGVRGFAELMLDCLDDGAEMPAGDIRRYAQTIVQQSDRMVHIIKHVRMFARDAGSAETAVVDLHDVVLSVLDLLMAQFNSHGILLERSIADQPLPIEVNAYSVEEVILNLLSNARHAVEQRRAIENGDYQPRIRVSAGEQAYGRGCVGFEVEDNGIGIPGDVAELSSKALKTTAPALWSFFPSTQNLQSGSKPRVEA